MPKNALANTDTTDKPQRAPTVTPTVKAAITLMVEEAMPWPQAAVAAGMTVRAMRKALEKPHVLKYMREQKQVFRAAICANNPALLAKIAQQQTNQNAAVNAIRSLEYMDGETGGNIASIRSPGFNILILPASATSVQSPTQRPTIDVTPVEPSLDSR